MERIDLSHPLNAPYRTSSNPNLTPPPRASTLPTTTPSLSADMQDGLERYPYSAEGEAGSSRRSPTARSNIENQENEHSPVGSTFRLRRSESDEGSACADGENHSSAQDRPEPSKDDGSDCDRDDDMAILDVSNTQWDAVVLSKRARDSERGSSRRSHSDAVTEESHLLELEKDRQRFAEEDAYWADVQRERGNPRRQQLATLSAKRKRAASTARSIPSSPLPIRNNKSTGCSSSDSASPIPWSPSPPPGYPSSRTSIQFSSSPKHIERGAENDGDGEARLENLFNTPPKAKARREPLRQIHLSDTEDEDGAVDLTGRSIDKGKGKALPSSPSPQAWHRVGGQDENLEEQDLPEDLAWMEAQDYAENPNRDDLEYDDFDLDEAELALIDPVEPPALASSSSSRKRRRATPTMMVDDDDDDPIPLGISSSSRRTPKSTGPLVNLSNLPLPLPLPLRSSASDHTPNVAGVHFSPLSASLGLSHPIMFISDLPDDIQHFYRYHGKGLRGANGAKASGEGGENRGKRARIEVIEGPTDDENEEDDWDEDDDEGGPQGRTGAGGRGKRGRGGGAGRGKKWGPAFRGRGGWRGRGRAKGRGTARKS